MDNEILDELKKKFEKERKDRNIKASLAEIDEIFFVTDSILKDGFVSEDVIRQINFRIAEAYMRWVDYFHGLLMPNPQNILNMSESKIFSSEEKKEFSELIKRAMELGSRNNLHNISKDLKNEAKFIDDAVYIWKKDFGPKVEKIMKKINMEWGKKE